MSFLCTTEGAILTVDDDTDFLNGFSTLLGNELPNEIVSATSGEEAIKICEERRGDIAVILLDQNMRLSGTNALRSIKEIDPTINIIFVTVVSPHEIESELIGYNIKGYYEKPLTFEDSEHLFALIQSLAFEYQMKGLIDHYSRVLNFEYNEKFLDYFITPSVKLTEMEGYVEEFIDGNAIVYVYNKENKSNQSKRIFPAKIFESVGVGEGMLFNFHSEMISNKIIITFNPTEAEKEKTKKSRTKVFLDDGRDDDDY